MILVNTHSHYWSNCSAQYCAECGTVRVHFVRTTSGGNITTTASAFRDYVLVPREEYDALRKQTKQEIES